ncbi:LysR family transcriptional regulator [Methylobacterium sp. WL103]|uniref:LysR family transcriptional regulator n=1 Tax=Methylobacterium sp. WL103 TaxID=2603891 RepID=UPI0011C7D020|nr:LysR family transcriptional regulator [Methylobacterium sp. WL103]TXM97658.1 LysR family transcriptional regulator [Methylobacterium sp. WL103]
MADFRSLEVFYWVATLSSFRRASEQVNTTQPAVSQRIAALEHEYGTLFERRSRDVALTERGRVLFGFAERFLSLQAEMGAALAETGRTMGTLRLGVSETIVHLWLSRFIERMRAALPGISVDIAVDISPNMQAALAANEIDLAFLVGPITLPSLANRPLFSIPVAWIAAPGLVPEDGPLSLGALIRHPLITYPRNTGPYVELRDLVLRANLLPSQIHTSASLATIVKMGIERLGICVIPPAVVRDELAAGALRILPAEQSLSDLNFTATFAKRPDAHFVADAARIAQEVAADWAAGRQADRAAGR